MNDRMNYVGTYIWIDGHWSALILADIEIHSLYISRALARANERPLLPIAYVKRWYPRP